MIPTVELHHPHAIESFSYPPRFVPYDGIIPFFVVFVKVCNYFSAIIYVENQRIDNVPIFVMGRVV